MEYEPSMSYGRPSPQVRPTLGRHAAVAKPGNLPLIRSDLVEIAYQSNIHAPTVGAKTLLEPHQLGADTQVEGSSFMTANSKSLLPISNCETTSFKEWSKPLSDKRMVFLRAKLRFLFDIGHALTLQREAVQLSRAALSRRAGVYRATLHSIETGQRVHQNGKDALAFEGSYIGKVFDILTAMDGFISLSLNPIAHSCAAARPVMLTGSGGKDNTLGALVKSLRLEVGLTQTELDGLLHETSYQSGSGRTASPMISRIENGRHQTGMRLGTFFAICFVCGFIPTINFEDHVHPCHS